MEKLNVRLGLSKSDISPIRTVVVSHDVCSLKMNLHETSVIKLMGSDGDLLTVENQASSVVFIKNSR